jgi:hypothetical protein
VRKYGQKLRFWFSKLAVLCKGFDFETSAAYGLA